MNLVNSYTLIFKKLITPKKFVWLLFLVLIGLPTILNSIGGYETDNNVIKNYQLNKIYSDDFAKIETIIVGDSSGGNAIDKKLFTNLSGTKTENLSLTGSWGLYGSAGIIEHSLAKENSVKNVIIIQTLDIWERSKSYESIIELYDLYDSIKEVGYRKTIEFFTNPKVVWWNIKNIIIGFIPTIAIKKEIDLKNDYILQNKKKFSNDSLHIDKHNTFKKIKLSKGKKHEILFLEKVCVKHSLNCIFINGPIHKQTINSKEILKDLQLKIKPQFKFIKYYDHIFSYPNHMIGDNTDHIDIEFKHTVTIDYYNLLKNDLSR